MMRFPRNESTRGALALAVLLAASAGTVAAQASDPLSRVDEGDHVWVTSRDGLETEGRVVGISSPRSLDLNVRGTTRTVRIEDILRIEAGDSVKNGAIVGAVVGGAAMAALAAWAIELGDEGQGVSRRDIFAAIRLSALAAGGGALTGAAIDRAIEGRRTLYAAPIARSAVTVQPLVSASSAGIRLTLNW